MTWNPDPVPWTLCLDPVPCTLYPDCAMRTLLRTLVWLAVVVWFGGLLFFPITAWAAFGTIADTHAAGTIVAKSLGVLHHEGLFAGSSSCSCSPSAWLRGYSAAAS